MPNHSSSLDAGLDHVFQALADATRRAVVERLARGPASVSELARPFAMALPSFTQHLDRLEDCGLVTSAKTGRVRTYELAPRSLKTAAAWLDSRRKTLGATTRPTRRAASRTPTKGTGMTFKPNPELDLVIERIVDVPPSFVWDAYTKPELLKRWFCPVPWQTVEAEIDLRPGGIFRTVMRGPEGQQFPNLGCYLEVVPGRRLVWTGALGPDYRPQLQGPTVPFVMTAFIDIEPTPSGGTKYTATVLHADVSGREQHEAMGFEQGWGAAFDQLVAMAAKA